MAQTLADWLGAGPYTLALSSGYFGFFAHAGVALALEQRGLKAERYSGASAGALVGAGLASGLSAVQLREILFSVRQKDFWDPRPGFGILRGQKFHDLIADHMAPTFAKAIKPLDVAVFDVLARRTRFLSTGPLPKAVVASCSVPLMFHPVWLEGRPFLDGGLFDKAAIPFAHERVLSVFLESRGWMGIYERKVSFTGLKADHKVVRMANLPAVNFNTLTIGPSAFHIAWERFAKALDQPAHSQFLQA